MRDDLVLTESVNHRGVEIALLTLNRPELHNPVNEPTIAVLESTITAIVDDKRHRAIVITGSGASFSSGGDLKGYQALFRDRERFAGFVAAFGRVCKLLERSPLLTVAMVNGTCMAGGMELALSCDVITIAGEARIGDGHMKFSQMPGSGCQRLIRAIGLQRARHWLISGDLHAAKTAVEAGLAIGSVPREQLRQYTFDEVARLARVSPAAFAKLKSLINVSGATHLDPGLEIEEQTAIEYATGSPDAVEGIMAFAERREPSFQPL